MKSRFGFENYSTVSPSVREQAEMVKDIWLRRFGDGVKGIYVHGSMALECFREGVSDLDILIVCAEKIPREERIVLAGELIDCDRSPCPLEMSAIREADLKPWTHPTICQFHYSDHWTEQYKRLLVDPAESCYIVDNDFADPDIACHVKLTRQRGLCLYGPRAADMFPDVPEEDFWQSISCDIDDYSFGAYEPRYFTSNILILGRILSYKREKRILSKYEGALWTMERVPARFRGIIDSALDAWYGGAEFGEFDREDLEALRKHLISEIKVQGET